VNLLQDQVSRNKHPIGECALHASVGDVRHVDSAVVVKCLAEPNAGSSTRRRVSVHTNKRLLWASKLDRAVVFHVRGRVEVQ
jgi:hypothetical protein